MTSRVTRSAPTLGRCVALNQNGRRCREAATMRERYHGNEEFYGYFSGRKGVGWIVAAFCESHGQKPKRKTRNP